MPQSDLFGEPPVPAKLDRAREQAPVVASATTAEIEVLAQALHRRFEGRLHLGTSSWNFPGWRGLVWDDRAHAESELSRHGLPAYAQHPLFNTVSLDRAVYRAVDAETYARLARQVPDAFRFVVKAPAEITDATLRQPESGAPLAPNPHFLDPQRTLDMAVRPAVLGLGVKLGVLVFQLPPLPAAWLRDPQALLGRLEALWRAVVPALPDGARAALELRDARAVTPALIGQLTAHGVRYCVGLHDRMPSMTEQLPMLRANWPGDLVCRWNLHRGLRYEQAKAAWAPFNRLQAPDPDTREALARAIVGTLAAGFRAFVTINNKAEGSAPLSVIALASAIWRRAESPNDNAP